VIIRINLLCSRKWF